MDMSDVDVQTMMHEINSMKKAVSGLSSKIEKQIESIHRVEEKVFNGFGTRIDAVKESLEEEKRSNEINHNEIKSDVKSLNKFVSIALVSIFIAILGVLGAVWGSSRAEDKRQQVETNKLQTDIEEHMDSMDKATIRLQEALDETFDISESEE